RIDAAKCAALFESWIDLPSIDMAFICGPEPMMLAIAAALKEHGLGEAQIKFELFASGQPGRARQRAATAVAATSNSTTEAVITLDGATRSLSMPKEGTSLLDAALAASLDAPYACKAGVCSTCRAKVLEGEVEMAVNHALEDYEVRQGYVLTCQCFPLSDKVVVSYDQ
ncbi:MAG: 2Fe-2S iron-sulfur cluster-binding protein, partial [Geminicoccaceae bacterium]